MFGSQCAMTVISLVSGSERWEPDYKLQIAMLSLLMWEKHIQPSLY